LTLTSTTHILILTNFYIQTINLTLSFLLYFKKYLKYLSKVFPTVLESNTHPKKVV